MVTNLPIQAGDKVRLLVLQNRGPFDKRQNGPTPFCHPDEMWAPYSLPIKAEYDDYGGVEGISQKDPAFSLFQQQILDNYGCLLDPEVVTDWLRDQLERHGQRYPNLPKEVFAAQKKASDLSYALILEEVYQKFIKLTKRHNQELVASLEKSKAAAIHEIKNPNAYGFENDNYRLQQYLWRLQWPNKYMKLTLLGGLQDWMDFMYFYFGMEITRKIYSPMSGQGSQDLSWEFHESLARMSLKYANLRKIQYNNWVHAYDIDDDHLDEAAEEITNRAEAASS